MLLDLLINNNSLILAMEATGMVQKSKLACESIKSDDTRREHSIKRAFVPPRARCAETPFRNSLRVAR